MLRRRSAISLDITGYHWKRTAGAQTATEWWIDRILTKILRVASRLVLQKTETSRTYPTDRLALIEAVRPWSPLVDPSRPWSILIDPGRLGYNRDIPETLRRWRETIPRQTGDSVKNAAGPPRECLGSDNIHKRGTPSAARARNAPGYLHK